MFAFGISEDDVLAVALKRGLDLSEEQISHWFDELDTGLVEDAALQADDLDDQTTLAHAEIERQLDELGLFDSLKADERAQHLDEGTPTAPATAPRRGM